MYITFDEDEYSEPDYDIGMDDFTEHIKVLSTRAPTIGTDQRSSRARATVSERTRTLANQTAIPLNRSPSPMDVDPTIEEIRKVGERASFSIAGQRRANDPILMATTPAGPSFGATARAAAPAGAPSTSKFRPAPSVPAKRPNGMRDSPDPGSSSLSPSSHPQPQPPKRRLTGESSSRELTPAYRPTFGTELKPFIIAHDTAAQSLLDEYRVAWGTTYEIARGIAKRKPEWGWSEVTREKVEQLCGPNAHAAQRVAAVIKGHGIPRFTATELWAEYDREQDAIIEGQGRGLGGMGFWKGKDDWYGGRIQQVGRLVRAGRNYAIELENPEIRRSHRFSRFLGSRRILQVTISDDLLYEHGAEVRHLLSSSKFILCGRVFLPFHAKEGGVYMLETDQDYERPSSSEDGDHLRISLSAFIQWHNPLALNSHQPISKWSTRWALGLSTSVPTIEFTPENIIYDCDDIYATPELIREEKPGADQVMTDGCGFINGAALTKIMQIMKYGSRPTAVQGRLGGAKGMWVLHPDPLEQRPDGPFKIWIRPSQHKIKLGPSSKLGKAQRMFDLLAPARVTGPSRLSAQTLVNLAYNGISHETLKGLMESGLSEELQPFTDWGQSHSMILLWKAVERAGNVVVTRLRRMLVGQARALGLGQLRPLENQGQEDEEDEGDLVHPQRLVGSGHKRFSGEALTLHENVLELLQSGFHPQSLDALFQKLELVMSMVVDSYVEKFHIPVKESCEAYIIPDPYGVLQEGQIHFRTSEPFVDPTTGEQMDIILGDVLVSRNPTRLPSDVQKVKAVAHEKLSKYVNVIIFPIKGKQSLASFLGGGDYDGDTVMVNWNKSLVEQFRGSPLCKSPGISAFFERKVETVKDFDKRVSALETQTAQQALQEILLLGLAETRVGIYSKFHDAAVYKHGYGSEAAICLAYIFTTCLDASKTGLRIKEDAFKNHKNVWGNQKPWYEWKLKQGFKTGEKAITEKQNLAEAILCNPASPPFILDMLVKKGEELKEKALEDYKKLQSQPSREDTDISRPWNDAKDRAVQFRSQGFPGFAKNLEAIHAHVEEAWKGYRRAVKMKTQNSKGSGGAGDNPYEMVASHFSMSPEFGEGIVVFTEEEIRVLKASCASIFSLQFAFSVAFHDLCLIKARAAGYLPMTHQFAQCISIPSVVSRTLSQVHSGERDFI